MIVHIKGTNICCDRCMEPLYKFNRDMHSTDYLSVECVDTIPPMPQPSAALPVICWKCGFYASLYCTGG